MDASPPPVCLATTARQAGGVWRHICELADGLIAAGATLRIELPQDATALREQARERGFRLDGPAARHEVYHAHLADTFDRAVIPALVRARARGDRVVLTEHLPRTDASDPRLASRPPRPGATHAKTAVKQLHLTLAHRLIAVSTGSAEFLRERYRVPQDRVVTVFNGVAVDPTGPPPAVGRQADCPQFVATGSVNHQKGYDLLAAAAAGARRDWRVDVWGEGAHRARLRDQVAELKLTDGRQRVVFHGWTDDVLTQVRAADALLMPSRWEAFPYSALDAMAQARPVIGTRVDGLVDAVEPGTTGILVDPRADALADALDAFAADPAPAAAMGQAGYRRVRDHFRLADMLAETIGVYERCWGRLATAA